jgi:hypothetical protein
LDYFVLVEKFLDAAVLLLELLFNGLATHVHVAEAEITVNAVLKITLLVKAIGEHL